MISNDSDFPVPFKNCSFLYFWHITWLWTGHKVNL
jgi:hypothetical protein